MTIFSSMVILNRGHTILGALKVKLLVVSLIIGYRYYMHNNKVYNYIIILMLNNICAS